MREFDKIKHAINFMYSSQGYVDVNLCSKMANVPGLIMVNVLEQEGFKESGRKDQFIKVKQPT